MQLARAWKALVRDFMNTEFAAKCWEVGGRAANALEDFRHDLNHGA